MSEEKKSLNFIEQIIEDDLANGLDKNKLRFRFPPEPNGYLHIGHAAAICLNFGLGLKYNAPVNLRFDDTNPAKEEQEYVDAIKADIKWLGFDWDNELYSSDYFDKLYNWAIFLIKEGKAYVDNQTSEQIREQKGTPTEVGTNSPNRDRSIEDNLDLFTKMKTGELEEGTHVLRAKIDMSNDNMHMRDPIMYRSLNKEHHRTGNDWKIYPMYDWTHGESDYLENISHSICTLEFKSHRELYDWYLDEVVTENIRPKQREFARRNLSYTIMSKRKLLKLVEGNFVSGWDDPRMPTISGLRRRGYTPKAIIDFSTISGISKRENVTDVALLEHCIKEDLNKTAPRVMAVLNPLKVVITNYPEDKEEIFDAKYNDYQEGFGSRDLPFSKEIYIEKEDFKEEASKKFFRLRLDGEVRLKNAYIIKANSVVKDSEGNVLEVHCTYDEDSLSGSGTEASKRKVKGTLHWVSVKHAVNVEVRVYDRLFLDEAPDSHKDKDFIDFINPNSLIINKNAFVEPSLKDVKIGDNFQFQRLGYFNVDTDSTAKNIVFNRTVALKDSWAKIVKKQNNKNINNADSVLQKEIMPLTGKYLKAREEEDRIDLITKVFEFSKQVIEEELIAFVSKAESNKDYLTALMILNSENVSIDFGNKENLKKVNSLIGKALEMKNSYVRFQAVDCIGKNLQFKDAYIDLLNVMQIEDKNTHIVERLKGFLSSTEIEEFTTNIDDLIKFYKDWLKFDDFYELIQNKTLNNSTEFIQNQEFLNGVKSLDFTASEETIHCKNYDLRVDVPVWFGDLASAKKRIIIFGSEPRATNNKFNIEKIKNKVFAVPFGIDRWNENSTQIGKSQNVFYRVFEDLIQQKNFFIAFSDIVKTYEVWDKKFVKMQNAKAKNGFFQKAKKIKNELNQEIELIEPDLIIVLDRKTEKALDKIAPHYSNIIKRIKHPSFSREFEAKKELKLLIEGLK